MLFLSYIVKQTCRNGSVTCQRNLMMIKALANEDTLLRTLGDTNVFPFARAHNICCGHKFGVTTNVSDFVRNILCPQQMFSSLRGTRNIMSNNMSATLCPEPLVAYRRLHLGRPKLSIETIIPKAKLYF